MEGAPTTSPASQPPIHSVLGIKEPSVKRLTLFFFLILLVSGAPLGYAQPPWSSGVGGCTTRADCSAIVTIGQCCINSSTGAQCNGNGVICSSVSSGTQGPAGPQYNTTSTSNITPATGSKTFTVVVPANGLAYAVGNRLRAASAANPTTKYMEGVVTSYSAGSLVMTVDTAAGAAATARRPRPRR